MKPIFCNDAANARLVSASLMGEEGGNIPVLTLANAADGWLRLLPAGEYPHSQGMQVVDAPGIESMVNAFKGALAKLKSAFNWFTGANSSLPIYLGHPDDAYFSRNGHGDWNQYGRVTDMKEEGGDLWVNVAWSDLGRQLLAAGRKLFFSPRWEMEPLANGKFRTARLISLGLTPFPNITAAAAANQNRPTMKNMPKWLETLLLKLGFSNEAVNALKAEQAEGAPTEEQILGKVETLVTSSNSVATLTTDKQTLEGQLAAARTEAANHDAAFKKERKARVELLLANGIREGKVAPTEQAAWSNEFCENFDAALGKLEKAAVKLPVKGREHAKDDKTAANQRTKTEQITEFCNAAMPSCGNNWDRAYAKVQREHPDLFEEQAAAK